MGLYTTWVLQATAATMQAAAVVVGGRRERERRLGQYLLLWRARRGRVTAGLCRCSRAFLIRQNVGAQPPASCRAHPQVTGGDHTHVRDAVRRGDAALLCVAAFLLIWTLICPLGTVQRAFQVGRVRVGPSGTLVIEQLARTLSTPRAGRLNGHQEMRTKCALQQSCRVASSEISLPRKGKKSDGFPVTFREKSGKDAFPAPRKARLTRKGMLSVSFR